jgi:hypothetical protein
VNRELAAEAAFFKAPSRAKAFAAGPYPRTQGYKTLESAAAAPRAACSEPWVALREQHPGFLRTPAFLVQRATERAGLACFGPASDLSDRGSPQLVELVGSGL